MRTTEHEKIMRATEEDLEWEDIQQYLAELEHASEIGDYKKIREVFLKIIVGFNQKGEIADSMYF